MHNTMVDPRTRRNGTRLNDFSLTLPPSSYDTKRSSRVIRNRANEVIGLILLHGYEGNEISYSLDERYRNRGIMTKMVQEFCQGCDLKRIIARVVEENIPSLRVLEKASFVRNPINDKGWIESTWLRPAGTEREHEDK